MFPLIVLLHQIIFFSLVTPVFPLPLPNQLENDAKSAAENTIMDVLIAQKPTENSESSREKNFQVEVKRIETTDIPAEARQFGPVVISLNRPLRIWALGSVSKFPPVFEHFVQRIQSYFSVYKYQDLSRPVEEIEMEAEKVSEPNVDLDEEGMYNDGNEDGSEDGSSNVNEEATDSETATEQNLESYSNGLIII